MGRASVGGQGMTILGPGRNEFLGSVGVEIPFPVAGASGAKGALIALLHVDAAVQFQGMSSSQREAGQSLAILAMTSAI